MIWLTLSSLDSGRKLGLEELRYLENGLGWMALRISGQRAGKKIIPQMTANIWNWTVKGALTLDQAMAGMTFPAPIEDLHCVN